MSCLSTIADPRCPVNRSSPPSHVHACFPRPFATARNLSIELVAESSESKACDVSQQRRVRPDQTKQQRLFLLLLRHLPQPQHYPSPLHSFIYLSSRISIHSPPRSSLCSPHPILSFNLESVTTRLLRTTSNPCNQQPKPARHIPLYCMFQSHFPPQPPHMSAESSRFS